MKPIISVAILLALVGCGDDASGPIACTEEARSSVTLKLLDAVTNDAMAEATVVYSVNNGIEKTVTCTDNNVSAEDYCGSFVLDYEVSGDYEITVSSPGYVDKTKTVTIEKTDDGCHVIGQALTFKMNTI